MTKNVNEICQNAQKKKNEGLGDKTRISYKSSSWGDITHLQHSTGELRAMRYHLQRLKVKQLPIIPSADTALTKCEDGRNTFNTFVGLQDLITFVSREHY